MDSPIRFPSFKWTQLGTSEYFKAIDKTNEIYKKMLMIGEAKKVFRDWVCPLMTAKTKEEFNKAFKTLDQKYRRYIKTSKATLHKLSVDVEFVPDPRKYCGTPGRRRPTLREIIAKEMILKFEHYMESLNMFMCSQCRECHIESREVTDKLMYECKSCKNALTQIITSRIIFTPFGI